MGRTSRSSGGEFDPCSAQVYGPTRASEPSGESALSAPTPVLLSRIKSPRGLFTTERENQAHSMSVSDMVIEIRSEGGGDNLTADMWIVHRGITYWIKGKLGIDWRAGTTLYQVSTQNDFGRS